MSSWDRDCHQGPRKVLEIGKTVIWAGSETKVWRRRDWDLVISLCRGAVDKSDVLTTNKLGDELLPMRLKKIPEVPRLIMDWSDRDAGPVTKRFWDDLVVFLKSKPLKVGLHCQGGHGRTGTALAILAAKGTGLTKKKDPVAYIRDRYCDKAAETNTQLDYIEEMTGYKVKVGPSDKLGPLGAAHGAESHYPSAGAGMLPLESIHNATDTANPLAAAQGAGMLPAAVGASLKDTYFQGASDKLTKALSKAEAAEEAVGNVISDASMELAAKLLDKAQEEVWSVDDLRELDGMTDQDIADFYGISVQGLLE